ncbi:L,D-transpeptidase [Enterovirga sp.]|jgi:lipoprotein-anchoring transpeptidase ErfK/SrfK|uniref:L,D-transpeptidase family protein n=1 Tax=Enterovirga sp. TaxID=2026350 RepID=UPI002627B561|nr:L,D-transpeptidase [Enterovirga sp.]MDB5591464.1 L,D-transpeptidase [Enterovirga sp.]
MTTRRAVLGALLGAPLAACQSTRSAEPNPANAADADYARWYRGSVQDGPYEMPLVDRSLLDPELAPRTVAFSGGHRPGTVVVDIDERRLYLVQAGGTALRYGVGVGKQGFAWRGVATIGRKAHWPNWSPTAVMVRINPKLARYAAGGLGNPLGARALYLHQGGRDTMFRIHGTNEPWSIGTQVSSGCIRLLNEDVVDLYDRVPVGTTVYVRRSGARRA